MYFYYKPENICKEYLFHFTFMYVFHQLKSFPLKRKDKTSQKFLEKKRPNPMNGFERFFYLEEAIARKSFNQAVFF